MRDNNRKILENAKRSYSKQSGYAQLEKTEQKLVAQLNRIQRRKGSSERSSHAKLEKAEHDLIVQLNRIQHYKRKIREKEKGHRFYSQRNVGTHVISGKASYYGKKFHGLTTASGVTFDMYQMTAAHKTLPFGTKLKVTSMTNGRSVIVMVNDRGPFVDDRILDLSYAAAANIGMIQAGTGDIKMQVLN